MKSITHNILFSIIVLNAMCVFGSAITLTLENDSFKAPSSDDDYTHGTGLEYTSDSLWHFKFGQNMYAPSDLTKSYHIEGDRPYAGFLYGGVGYEFFHDFIPEWTHYGELDFGMIGPAAFAGHTQKFIHRLLNCRTPMGWHNQLHNEFVVNGQWWEKYNWYLCDYVALVPRAGVLAGTIEDAAEVGCDLKVGWNLKNDVGNSLMFSAAPTSGAKSWLDDIQAYIYVGVDERAYLYNHFLQGSFIRSKDRDQHLDVEIEPFVGEAQGGICIQYKHFMAKYYMVIREDEFKKQTHSPNYAGVVFGWVW